MPDFKEVKEILEFYKKEEPNTYDKYMNIYEKEYPDIYKKLKRELEKPGIKKPPKKIIIIVLLAVAVSLGIYLVINIFISQIGRNTAPSIDSFLIPETLTLNSSIMPKIRVSDKEGNIGSVSLKYVSPSSKEYECNAEKEGDLWEGCAVSLNEGGIWKVYVYAKDAYETASASFDVYVPVSKTCETSLNCGNLTCKNKILINYSCIENICYSKRDIVNCCENTDCISVKSCNKTTYNCFSKTVCGNGICEEPENCGSCTKDCLTQGKICCNNETYVGNCCSDNDCDVGESCLGYICQTNTEGRIIKIVFNDTAVRRNANATWDSQIIKLWSDPVEVWASRSSACGNNSNLKAVYQAVNTLNKINKMDNLTENDITNLAGWILSKYENGEFKDCFTQEYTDEIKTLFALEILNYTGYLGLVSEYEGNITEVLYNKAKQGFDNLPNMCREMYDSENIKTDYSRQISVYLQVKRLFNQTISNQEKAFVVNALKCSYKTDGTWINMENAYWTVEALNIINSLETIKINKTIDWIKSCQYEDGHFGKDVYNPSISGHWQAVKVLIALNATDKINRNLALEWTTSRLLRNWTSFKEKYGFEDGSIDKTDEDLKLRWFTVDSYFLLKQAVAE